MEISDDIFKHCWCLDVSFVPPLNSNEAPDMSGILSTRNICQKPQTVNHTGHLVSSCFCSYRILDFPHMNIDISTDVNACHAIHLLTHSHMYKIYILIATQCNSSFGLLLRIKPTFVFYPTLDVHRFHLTCFATMLC